MWLPIIGFCDGWVYERDEVNLVRNSYTVHFESPSFYYVRSVSVKMTKAGPEWYDGYKFEIQIVSPKKIILSKQYHIVTVRARYDRTHDNNIATGDVFVWGNHTAYLSESVELNKKTLERLYVYTFQGVQIPQELHTNILGISLPYISRSLVQ